jgi:lipopolysaccharide export system permease protein
LRYFASVAAATTALMLVALVVLVVAVTLVESAGDITDAESQLSAAFWLACFSAIDGGYQVLPIACFMGALVAGALLARRGELLAAQAAGVSSLRLVAAFLAVVIGTAGLGAACGELLVPQAVAGAERVQREQLHHRSALSRFYDRRLQWFREGDLLLYLPALDVESQTFPNPVVYRFVDGLIAEVIEGSLLRHDGAGWWLEEVKIRTASGAAIVTQPSMPLELAVTPTDLIDITGDPRQMTGAEVRELIGRREKAGVDTTSHRIELHNRAAAPFSAIWMFALVSPWALHPERRRSMARTLGAGVITIALLLSVTHVFRVLALQHSIPAAFGAWGAALSSLAVLPLSLGAYRRFRTRGTVL